MMNFYMSCNQPIGNLSMKHHAFITATPAFKHFTTYQPCQLAVNSHNGVVV